ncbi:polysaccharide pyruvyl transferase family protein [Amaricoccus sp. W119]|uniref:polysaccharide pyruvyl transferase family protein n=1 Tax=Amaricoccus sp. W119 TaxID=3391833 RepID=UPI0039A5DE2B
MTAFLSLRTRYENLGNEIINTLLIRELCRRGRVVGLGSGVPGWYLESIRAGLGRLSERLTVVPRRRQFALAILKAGLREPGSLIFTSRGDVSNPRSNYRRDVYLYALQRLPGMNLALVGASFDTISPSKAWLLRAAQRRGGAISVRDSRSRLLLAGAGVGAPLVPDLAFLLPTTEPKAGPRRLALFMPRRRATIPVDKVAGIVAHSADVLRSRGLEPAIAWQSGQDASFCRALARAAGLPVATPSERTVGRLPAMEKLYRESAIVLSNRLHALLIAAANGALPVALLEPEETRVRGIFEDAGWADLVTDARAVPDLERLAGHRFAREGAGPAFADAAERIRCYLDRVVGQPDRQPECDG